MRPRSTATADALLDLDVGPILDAADPYRPHHHRRTLRDMARRDDPDFERRMHATIYGTAATMGRAADAFAAAEPALRRAMTQFQRDMAAAMAAPPPPRGYPQRRTAASAADPRRRRATMPWRRLDDQPLEIGGGLNPRGALMTLPMWQLYQFPLCPFSRKVRLALAEKAIPHELVRVSPWLQEDEFIDLNPGRRRRRCWSRPTRASC